MPTSQYGDDDTTFVPFSAYKALKQLLIILLLLIPTAIMTFLTTYVVSCYLDKTIPMEITSFTTTDTYIGGTFNMEMKGRRIKRCEITVYHQAIDMNGTVVYEKVIDRPSNGLAGNNIDAPYYDIPLNNRARVPGPAKMSIYFQWRCPYNIVQKYIHPLEKTISADFYIYATKEDWEAAQAKKGEQK